MDHGSLSSIQLGLCHRAIHVRLSRLWEYRGGIGHGSVKLLHMVLSDRQGNHITALVPTSVIAIHVGSLHEGLTCALTHYLVAPRLPVLNMVDVPLMIQFTSTTTVRPLSASKGIFCRWIYNLTPVTELPPPSDTPACFVDVLGFIIGVSPVVSYSLSRVFGTVRKRHVLLLGSKDHEIVITLWGDAADRFDAENIYSLGQTDMVAAIFVGTTVRVYDGSKQLAGGAACRWYMDEDIPDIVAFRSSYLAPFKPIALLPIPGKTNLHQQTAVPTRRIPLAHLLNFNSYEKKESQFRCTVRITKLASGLRWWATCCTRCGNFAVPATSSSTQPDIYSCSRSACPSTSATIRFRLCLIGRDTTGEAEFVVCGNTAETIVGLSVYEIIKNNRHADSSVINLAVAASQIRHIPAEFGHLTSMLCRFVVNVSAKSFCGTWPSFMVSSIESHEPAPVTSPLPDAVVLS
ncbi:hypothetical protein ACQ4PT_045087 [Festuca glaucescens]